MSPKVVSKFYRIRMSDQIRRFLQSLPFTDLTEEQIGDYIYFARGKFCTGLQNFPSTVKIKVVDERPMLYVDIPHMTIKFNGVFDSFMSGQAVRNVIMSHQN